MVEDISEETPAGQRVRALRDLVSSDGWRVFEELMERDWGAETVLRKTEAALRALEGAVDQATINDTVQQIHASRRAVLGMRMAPHDEIAALTGEQKARRPFEAFRRMGR